MRMAVWGSVLLGGLLIAPVAIGAEEAGTQREIGSEEFRQLEDRIRALEQQEKEVPAPMVDEKPHQLHPIHALGEAKITGGLTLITQGTSSDQLTPQNAAEASLSLDLFFENQVTPSGVVLVYLNAQQGPGLTTVPMFTGPNADIETHDRDLIALHEAWYQHAWGGEQVVFTVGKYDPSGFFDANAFANDERYQFLGSPFVNNPALEFGGDADGYGLGAVLRVEPVEGFEAAVGVEEGDGDFEDAFAKPWTIAEVVFEPHWGGREGHYRAYAWQNRLLRPRFLGGEDTDNRGFGVSADHQMTDHLGLWARFGTQDGAVAPFDRATAAGIHLGGGLFGRPDDTFGLGYATLTMSDEYRTSQAAAGFPEFDGDEGYWEAYYRIVFSGDAVAQGVSLTPDVQYVTNAGGDTSLDPIVIWGLRLQALF